MSADRGATFTNGTYDPALFGTDDIRAWTVRAGDAGAARGAARARGHPRDCALRRRGPDVEAEWDLGAVPLRLVDEVGEIEGPEGQPRLLASEPGTPRSHTARVAYSDDGGETWSTPLALPDAQDGGVGYGGGMFVSLAPIGLPRSSLAVMARGYIYRTDDGGESWALVGRAPVPHEVTYARDVLLDEAGRLVVAAPGGNVDRRGGVFRTANPISVAAEVAPPEASGAVLRIEPNPASGVAQVRLALASPEADVRVSVFDARGREVAVLASGARGTGTLRSRWTGASGGGRVRGPRGGGGDGCQRPVRGGALSHRRGAVAPAASVGQRAARMASTALSSSSAVTLPRSPPRCAARMTRRMTFALRVLGSASTK